MSSVSIRSDVALSRASTIQSPRAIASLSIPARFSAQRSPARPACVARFWTLLPGHELQLASGAWFGESERVFRLGFGYLAPARLEPALASLSAVLDAAEA